jgi:hypothetical protein
MLVVGLGGCHPYLAATSVVHETYGVATDLRSVSTKETDTQGLVLLTAGPSPAHPERNHHLEIIEL